MTREDINDIINAICPNDEDYEKPCISPKYLRQELEQLVLDQRQWNEEPTTKNDLGVDCISRADVLKLMQDNWHTHNGDWAMQESMDDIRALPSVTPQEPKTGHWIKYGIPRCGEQHYKCTNCDEYFNFGLYSDYYKKAFKFCPNCGAKMVELQESEG